MAAPAACSRYGLFSYDVTATHLLNNTSYVDAPQDEVDKHDFHAGLVASVLVTLMSELGDKSFLMSAILAMHHSRTLTFLGSVLGQLIMTGVAVGLGLVTHLVPEVYTKWLSCVCMSYFGLRMLREGFTMSEEVEEEEEGSIEGEGSSAQCPQSCDKPADKQSEDCLQYTEVTSSANKQEHLERSQEGVLMQAFTLSFLGEWGDRSQISTILLASHENPLGVAVGSMLGHVVCSLMAVVGGRFIGQKFPVKTMTQAGGVVFLLCAASAVLFE